ncbi:MAG TPA: GreA/GreB family elongation factor [Burkholderiales bacterium]|nr:GreA/GreB family elongation factor [Burkholderiales bacterium]
MRRLIVTEADAANLSLLGSPAVRRILAHATVVASDAVPSDVVTMNSRAVCRDLATGKRRLLSVVYPEDANENAGRISILTPGGLALFGATAGQNIEWDHSDGHCCRMHVDAVVHQPEQDLRSLLIVRT